MSIGGELMKLHPEVIAAKVNKSDLHGEDATWVYVVLNDGRSVEGWFAKHPRSNFGGVQFSGPKDVVALMSHKIDSVLRGTNE